MKPVFSRAFKSAVRYGLQSLLVLAGFAAKAQAPTIRYSGSLTFTEGTAITPVTPTSSGVATFGYSERTTAVGSGYNFPHGVAVDAAGNIYVADMNNGVVKKILAGGEATITLGSGFSQPDGITVDAAGNVYVADAGTGIVSKIPAGGGAMVTLASGLSTPCAMALDAKGNLLVTAIGGNEPYLYEIPTNASIPFVIFSGVVSQGIALDPVGDLYIYFSGESSVRKYLASGLSEVNIGAGFENAEGIALDNGGNLYVADWGHGTVKVVPAAGGSIAILGSGFAGPNAVAVGANGNLYVTDDQTNSLNEINPVGGYFISPALPAGLSFNCNTGVISGTPITASPATTYTITAYNSTGSSATTISIKVNQLLPTLNYHGPDGYLVNKVMSPLQPTTANVGALNFPTDVGYPRYPGSAIWGNGFNTPGAIATDDAGNVYLAEIGAGDIKKIPAAGGAPVTIGSGYALSTIAVDGAGNVYVGANGLYKIPADGSARVTISSSIAPRGIAIDSAGNVYASDQLSLSVFKYPAGGGARVTLASGYQVNGDAGFYPGQVALDGLGNLYVSYGISQGLSGSVAEISLANGQITSHVTNVTTFITNGAGYLRRLNNKLSWQVPTSSTDSFLTFIEGGGLTMDNKGILYETGTEAGETSGVVLRVVPSGGYFLNALLPAGMKFDNTTGVISGTPTILTPGTNYEVTAYNSYASSTATVNIKTMADAGDNLENLTVSKGKLSPVFAVGTTGYTDNVGLGNSSLTVTPYALDAGATITVNGNPVVSGTASAPIPLSFGPNTISVVVTASDGVTTNTYTITANRVSSNADLAALHPSTATTPVSPSFTPDVYNYSVGEGYVTTAITLTPKTSDANATVTVNGQPVVSGAPSQSIPLQVGANIVTTTVTAQDGVTTQTYTFTVNRAGSNNAFLANLLASTGPVIPGFASNIFSYSSNVDNSVSSISITPTTSDVNATVTVNGTPVASGMPSGPIALSTGENTITIVVTGQDGVTTKTYTLTVTRGLPDANLASLTTSGGQVPLLSPDTTNYTLTVGNTVSSITLTPVTSSPGAIVTVNIVVVASGTASSPIALHDGENNILVEVIASDRVTTKTYTITVIRTPANFAYLAHLSLNGGAVPLSPSFDFNTMSYTASVPNSTATATVTPLYFNSSENATVNGITVANHTASNPIALAVGANTISVVVTAQDGVTTQTYAVTVTRATAPVDSYSGISVSNPATNPSIIAEDIKVHQGISPNGDGIDDVFTIDNIANYPQNNLMIMDRNGALIYQAKGYDNLTKAFDGHSNINGRMQLPGTYFYALDYTLNGITTRKTGFIVLKY